MGKMKEYYFDNDRIESYYHFAGKFTVTGKDLKVSDGHHTMDELYEHRHALFAALIKIYDGYITPLGATAIRCWKSRFHADGSSYEGWFIAGMSRINIDGSSFHVSYHLPDRWWDRIRCKVEDTAPPYDGYTSDDVIERLQRL